MTETMTETLIWQFLYWTLMAIATFTSFRYFRDLGDITQAFMKVTRKNMLFAIRYEHQIIVVSLVAVGAATWIGYRFAVGWGSSTTILLTVNLFFIGFP